MDKRISVLLACLVGASLGVAFRLALFDWQILAAINFPNHDMSQGASFFVTNLHSLRVSGEIVWWKSNALNGYAQYYQSFLGPLAPTSSHISFYMAAAAMAATDLLKINVSEYILYVATGYVLLPWCAFAGFGLLTSRFVQHPLAIVFSCIVYALSTIGLWDSAWFYFQEPATINFLLAATVGIMQKPSRTRVAVFLAAVLIQAASINYWTIYNLFFAIIFIGGYAAFFPTQLCSAIRTLSRYPRLLTVPTLCIAAIWIALLTSMAVEQAGQYVRPTSGSDHYDVQFAAERAYEISPLKALGGMASRIEVSNKAEQPMHFARYVGILTLVLAGVALTNRVSRETLFLVFVAAASTVVIFAPPPLLWIWAHVPMMNTIQHLFRFYPHYVAQAVVLLAALGLDRLLGRERVLSVIALLTVLATTIDLGLYFRQVSELDHSFTERVIWPMMNMTPEKRAKLLSPLPPLSTDSFEGGVGAALPLTVAVFPVNDFLMKSEVFQFINTSNHGTAFGMQGPEISLQSGSESPEAVQPSPLKWTYNDFDFNVVLPAEGNLIIRQIPDPRWLLRIDGQITRPSPAFGGLAMSIPISPGRHEISMSYRPKARAFYWPASFLLLVNLVALATYSIRSRVAPYCKSIVSRKRVFRLWPAK